MSWDAISAIAEIVAAAGVIVTLVYLAVQIRNSAMVDRANIRATLTQGSMSVIAHAREDAEIFVKLNEGEALTDVERIKLTMFHRMAFRSYENYAYQYNRGLFGESEWAGFLAAIEALFLEPLAQEDWRGLRYQYSPAFKALIDPLVPALEDESKLPRHMYAGRRSVS